VETKMAKDAADKTEAMAEKVSSDVHPSNAAEASAPVLRSEPQEVMSVMGDNVQIKIAPRQRPSIMQGVTYKINTPYGNLYVTVNEDGQGPFEVFAAMGKAGGFFSAQTEAITRMISLALRSNVAIEEVIAQLKGIRGPDVSFNEDGMVFSLPDAIAKVLEKHIKRYDKQMALDLPQTDKEQNYLQSAKTETTLKLEEQITEKITLEEKISAGGGSALGGNGSLTYKNTQKISIANLGNAPVCPSCASMLILAEGCMKCDMCGYSKCG